MTDISLMPANPTIPLISSGQTLQGISETSDRLHFSLANSKGWSIFLVIGMIVLLLIVVGILIALIVFYLEHRKDIDAAIGFISTAQADISVAKDLIAEAGTTINKLEEAIKPDNFQKLVGTATVDLYNVSGAIQSVLKSKEDRKTKIEQVGLLVGVGLEGPDGTTLDPPSFTGLVEQICETVEVGNTS